MKFNNKILVVTGAGSGMGRELVLGLLSRNAQVAMVDIHEDALQETLELVPERKRGQLSMHVLDVSDQKEVEALPQKVISTFGAVDGIINNAGIIQPFIAINDLDYSVIHRVMNVNFFGTLFMTKAFLPHLLRRPEAHIINISSMGGFVPVPGQSIYGASKAAVKLMTEGLYAELKETIVHVSLVLPGAVATNIMINSGLEQSFPSSTQDNTMARTLQADRAAHIILEGAEKNKSRIFVGKDSKTMDRLYRLNPVYAINLIARQMKSLVK